MHLKLITAYFILLFTLASCQWMFYDGEESYPVDFDLLIAADQGPGKLRIYTDYRPAMTSKSGDHFKGFNIYRSPDKQDGTYLQRAIEYMPTRNCAATITGYDEWREGGLTADITPYSFTDTCESGRVYFYTSQTLYGSNPSTFICLSYDYIYENETSGTYQALCP